MMVVHRHVMLSLFVDVLVVAGCGPSGPAPDVLTQVAQIDLDLAVAGASGFPVAIGPVMLVGTRYVYDIEGTYSIWAQANYWSNGTCKAVSEPAPIFPSPGHANGEIGIDAEFFFAIPVGSSLCASDFVIPRHTSLIYVSLDGGTTFDHVEPVGGRPDAPRADHTYRYEVTGEGEAFHVRRRDDGVDGDYGVLRITLYRVD